MLIVATTCATGLSWMELDASRARAQSSIKDTQQIQAILAQLQTSSPNHIAPIATEIIADLPKTIADAADAVGIFQNVASQPLASRPYQRSTTLLTDGRSITIQNATLQQITDFLFQVTQSQSALRVTVLTLDASTSSTSTPASIERWTANANITYLRTTD